MWDQVPSAVAQMFEMTDDEDPVFRTVRIEAVVLDPGTHREFVRVAAFGGDPVGWDSPNAAIQVLRGATMTTWRTRHLSSMRGSLAWRARDDGTVRPVHL